MSQLDSSLSGGKRFANKLRATGPIRLSSGANHHTLVVGYTQRITHHYTLDRSEMS